MKKSIKSASTKNFWSLKSFFFVPLYDPRLFSIGLKKNAIQQAHALVLDLEDSLHTDKKEQGRKLLPQAVKTLRPLTKNLLVRINSEKKQLDLDLKALKKLPIDGLIPTKTEKIDQLRKIAKALPKCFLIPMIETPSGILNAESLVQLPQVKAVFFGPEDYSASFGVAPNKEVLMFAAQKLICTAAVRDLPAFGVVGSFAGYSRDKLRAFEKICKLSYQIGFKGTLAIHSSQIRIINKAFAPSEEQIQEAKKILSLTKENAVFSYQDELVGPPMIKRLRKMLDSNGNGSKP